MDNQLGSHLFKSEFCTRDGVVLDKSESLEWPVYLSTTTVALMPLPNGLNAVARSAISKIIWKATNEEVSTRRTFVGPAWTCGGGLKPRPTKGITRAIRKKWTDDSCRCVNLVVVVVP